MAKFLAFIACIPLVFGVPCLVKASNYYSGYVSPAGWIYNSDGYWYYNGVGDPYSRNLVYSYNGCSYPNGYYNYTRAYIAPKAAVIDYSDQDVEKKLVELAVLNVNKEAAFAKEASRQAHVRALAKDLGLTRPGGNYPYSANYAGVYGNLLNYPANSFNISANGINGQTIYGYNTQTTTALTGPAVDYSTLLLTGQQQSALLAKDSAGYADGANQRLSQLTDRMAGHAKELAEIEMRAKERIAVIQASVVPTATITTSTSGQGISTQPLKMEKIGPPSGGSTISAAFKAVVEAKCLSCHNATTKRGNFDINVWPSLNMNQKTDIVSRRLLTSEPDKLMPRLENGQPGVRLTEDEVRLFLNN